MQDGLVDWETGTSSAWKQEYHLGLSSCYVESSCLGEGEREKESEGEGTQSEESGAFLTS